MSNLLKGKGNYTKIQNQMIIWAAKRVLEEAGDSEKIEMFKGFCETKIDPELKMVDFKRVTHYSVGIFGTIFINGFVSLG